MAVLWVCVLTSECSLRGACPVSRGCRCSQFSTYPGGREPSWASTIGRPVYPVCPRWTLASCLPRIPHHRSNWTQCFWSTDSETGETKKARSSWRGGGMGRAQMGPGASREQQHQGELCSQDCAGLPGSGFRRGGQFPDWVWTKIAGLGVYPKSILSKGLSSLEIFFELLYISVCFLKNLNTTFKQKKGLNFCKPKQ